MSLDVYLTKVMPTCVFEANITHNLIKMAAEAGIYEQVWRPEECGIKIAADLIPHLEKGIEVLESEPARFRAMNPPNSWGKYEDFVPWLKQYLAACRENLDATIDVSR